LEEGYRKDRRVWRRTVAEERKIQREKENRLEERSREV